MFLNNTDEAVRRISERVQLRYNQIVAMRPFATSFTANGPGRRLMVSKCLRTGGAVSVGDRQQVPLAEIERALDPRHRPVFEQLAETEARW